MVPAAVGPATAMQARPIDAITAKPELVPKRFIPAPPIARSLLSCGSLAKARNCDGVRGNAALPGERPLPRPEVPRRRRAPDWPGRTIAAGWECRMRTPARLTGFAVV